MSTAKESVDEVPVPSPVSTDARKLKGQATRERILSVGTRLLAEQGYNGVSLRQVCTEADVNLALMSYHFGTKEKLLFAIFERGTLLINEERSRNIAVLEAARAESAPTIEAILHAFVSPTLRATDADNEDELNFLKLSGRIACDPTPEVRLVISKVYDNVALRFARLLRAACKHLSDEEFFMRLVFFYGAMLYTRADTGRVNSLAQQMNVALPVSGGAEACAFIVPFLAAGFQAPGIRTQSVRGRRKT
jgi:AcrR family transcriptional regulator